MVEEMDVAAGRREEPGFELGERQMLEGWLEFHRVTLQLKCEGLDDEQRKSRPVGTSNLSLHGLVRHMAEVELGWFQRCLMRDRSVPYLWSVEGVEDSEMVPLDDAVWEDDLAAWQRECETSRRVAADLPLEHTGALRNGELVSLRWIYTHMIEEYARHNGHADLIREMIDGAVGL